LLDESCSGDSGCNDGELVNGWFDEYDGAEGGALQEMLRLARELCQEHEPLANLPGVLPGKLLANCKPGPHYSWFAFDRSNLP